MARLKLTGLTANATYRYFPGMSTANNITTTSPPGNFIVINNTSGSSGFITGYSSSKGMAGSLMSGDESATTSRYGEYTGWFCVVPTGNAVFAEGNACYFYVQVNNGSGGTSISQAFRTTSTIKCLSPGQKGNNDKCTPFKIFTNAPAESIIATWADTTNTSGTYRPSYCNFVESNGISEGWNATSWYAASPSVDGTSGATMVLRNNNPGNAEGGEGIQSIVAFSTATGSKIGCDLINSSMVYSDGNNGTQSTAANGIGNYKSATPEEIYPNSLGANPSISIAASPSGTICSGTFVTFTATPTNGGTTPSYQWKLNGNNVGSNSTTYTNSSLANNDVVTCVITASADGCPFTNGISSNSVTMSVTSLPSAPSVISGSTPVCSGSSQTYSVTNVANTTYTWTLPGTWSGSSTTNSIGATVGSSGGTISVTATQNGCTSSATTLNVSVNTTPSTPSTISGSTPVCSGSSQTYSVTNVASTTYTWSLPGTWSGSSTTNSIGATVGSSGGTISVTATQNGCTSSARTLNVSVNTTPSAPSAISGSTPVCSGSSQTYSVTNVASTTYAWTLPGTWSGSSTTNSIGATVGSSGGTISVTATQNGCTSSATTLNVSVNTTPSAPSAISGSTPVCSGSSQTYSVTNVASTTYNWTLPGTWSGSSSTNSINATVGSSGGTISVTATQNGCTSTTASTKSVSVNSLPTVSVSALPDTICKWQGIVGLSGGSPSGGVFSGTGVTGSNLHPSQVNVGNSTITYTYTDGNGCVNSATETYYNRAGFIIPSGYDNTLPFDPCFQTQIVSGSNNWTYSTSNLNGVLAPASDGIFKFSNTNAGDKARLILPTIDFTGMNNPTMTLSWSRSNVSPSILDSVRILGSNDGGNTWSWLRSMGRASATNPNQAWQANVIPLYQYGNSSNIMIALEASSAGSGQVMGIDRIQFADSDCPQITGIGLNGNQNTATLSWNMVNNSTYTVRYGLRPDGPFTQTINNATSPITISSLILDTTYFFQVRQICQSPAVVVAWPTTYFTYYTGSNVASCQKPNGLYNSQGNSSTSRVLNWANTTTADSFQVQIWKDSLNNGNYTLVRAFFVNGANYTHTINNLSLSTNYRWRVRSRCGLNGVSVYSGWNYFTTPSSRLTAPQSNGFESMIALYPNPAHASVTLKIETEESGSNQLMLVDLNGKVVYSKSIEVSEGENEFSIGLDGFSAGIYQVIIKSETSVNYRKLIVQ